MKSTDFGKVSPFGKTVSIQEGTRSYPSNGHSSGQSRRHGTFRHRSEILNWAPAPGKCPLRCRSPAFSILFVHFGQI